MPEQDIQSLTSAFQDFNLIVDKFQKTYETLQDKIDLLTKQLDYKNKELEFKIQESENIKNFLDNILNNINSAVVVIDLQGIITHFNRAAEFLSGFEKEEILGKPYKQFFHKNSLNDSKSALYTLSTGKESYKRHKTISTKDCREIEIEFSTSVLKDINFKNQGVVETFTDVSEIKKLQERIVHVETLAALGEMSASVAHEIRNPLAGINGFAGLLDRQIDENDPRKKMVKPIIEGVGRLNNIVSNLLTLTRPQNLNLQPYHLNGLISDITDFFKMSVQNIPKQIDISINNHQDDPVVRIDMQLFQQVIVNLLKNAWDAIEGSGTITIDIKMNLLEPLSDILDEDEKKELIRLFSNVEILISDTGKGITDDNLAKIFNPFFTTKQEGNGLGLAICKKIIQLHKGDILVSSELNKGTQFNITIPLFEIYD